MIHKDLGFAEILITDVAFGHVGADDPTFRDRLKAAGYADTPLVWMKQEHTKTVQDVGTGGSDQVFESVDGLTTDQAGIRLVTKTADCVPVIVWNEKAHRIGVLHCGWKGFLKGIINSFSAIGYDDHESYGKDYQAFLGPHIRTESFEVRQDFIDALPEGKKHLIEEIDGKTHFNLTKGVMEDLEDIGITEVEDCGIDTYTDPNYFSYRGWCHLPEDDRPESYSTFASTILMR